MSTKAKLHSLCVKKSSLYPFSTGSKGNLENHLLVLYVGGGGKEGERVEDEEG